MNDFRDLTTIRCPIAIGTRWNGRRYFGLRDGDIMAATPPVSLEALKNYPTMTWWFHPLLLSKLLLRVIVSDMFGQYADRRLVMAALDRVPNKELYERTQLKLPTDADGNLWVDYVADLGDGFDFDLRHCLIAGERNP